MDFYRFINFKDIREYHKKINYQYNAAEAAWLVWQCKNAEIKEKHEAWQWIIDNMDDCQYAERLNYHCDPSIKTMLGKYMDFENRMIKEFFDGTDNNSLYVSKAIYRYSDGRIEYGDWSTWDGIYSDFEKCWNSLEIDDDYYKVIICKKPVDSDRNSIELCFDPKDKNRIYEFNLYNKYDLDENDVNLNAFCFEGMWFDFPTPFKKGDILINSFHNEGPFVNERINLEELDERVINNVRKGGDNSDMGYGGYFVTDTGGIFYDHGAWTYMDLEYYQKPLEGKLRILIPVSNYLKGLIGLEGCLLGYHSILMQGLSEQAQPNWITDEGLSLAGIIIMPEDTPEINDEEIIEKPYLPNEGSLE